MCRGPREGTDLEQGAKLFADMSGLIESSRQLSVEVVKLSTSGNNDQGTGKTPCPRRARIDSRVVIDER